MSSGEAAACKPEVPYYFPGVSHLVDIFAGLLLTVALLALVARKLSIPYPIFFVIGGLVLGAIPSAPKVRLNPEFVFFVFLPPLLFPAAMFMSWRDFRANLRAISLLAVGLVLFTTVIVALLAHYLMDLPWAAGFVLGAIVSPPDALAATAIAERLRVPQRIVTILEGESLVNDATALVTYGFAVAAVMTGSFSLSQAAAEFVAVSAGGILIGLGIGWLAAQFHKRVDDAPVEITVSLLTPFAAYLLAERWHVSGVLAVVTAGLYLGRRMPELLTFRTRLQGGPVWETAEFILNGCVFILIGLQFPEVMRALGGHEIPVPRLTVYAVIMSVAVIAIRILWVFPVTYLPRMLFPKIRERDPCPKWQHVTIVAWTGMRGVVSLAAVMALPLTTSLGKKFPGRDLILFLTFVVILTTLVVQGLTLPTLIRRLGIKEDDSMDREEREARLKANRAALERLTRIAEKDPDKADALQRLRIEYEDHIRSIEGAQSGDTHSLLRLFSSEYERLSYEALQQERETILEMRNQEVINDEVLRRIQHDIDLAEARLQQHE